MPPSSTALPSNDDAPRPSRTRSLPPKPRFEQPAPKKQRTRKDSPPTGSRNRSSTPDGTTRVRSSRSHEQQQPRTEEGSPSTATPTSKSTTSTERRGRSSTPVGTKISSPKRVTSTGNSGSSRERRFDRQEIVRPKTRTRSSSSSSSVSTTSTLSSTSATSTPASSVPPSRSSSVARTRPVQPAPKHNTNLTSIANQRSTVSRTLSQENRFREGAPTRSPSRSLSRGPPQVSTPIRSRANSAPPQASTVRSRSGSLSTPTSAKPETKPTSSRPDSKPNRKKLGKKPSWFALLRSMNNKANGGNDPIDSGSDSDSDSDTDSDSDETNVVARNSNREPEASASKRPDKPGATYAPIAASKDVKKDLLLQAKDLMNGNDPKAFSVAQPHKDEWDAKFRNDYDESHAVVIGIGYTRNKGKKDVMWGYIPGAVTDAYLMVRFLVEKMGFQRKNITLILDDRGEDLSPANRAIRSQTPVVEATKENITNAISTLVKPDSENPDSRRRLFLFYAGHGGKVLDTHMKKHDGYTKVMITQDEEKIPDQTLNSMIVDNIGSNAKLDIVAACCHSTTLFGLPYIYNASEKPANWKPKPTVRGMERYEPQNISHNVTAYERCWKGNRSISLRDALKLKKLAIKKRCGKTRKNIYGEEGSVITAFAACADEEKAYEKRESVDAYMEKTRAYGMFTVLWMYVMMELVLGRRPSESLPLHDILRALAEGSAELVKKERLKCTMMPGLSTNYAKTSLKNKYPFDIHSLLRKQRRMHLRQNDHNGYNAGGNYDHDDSAYGSGDDNSDPYSDDSDDEYGEHFYQDEDDGADDRRNRLPVPRPNPFSNKLSRLSGKEKHRLVPKLKLF